MKCDYCNREETRFYNKKRLCELHYLLENPNRAIRWVDWEQLGRYYLSKEELMSLLTLKV